MFTRKSWGRGSDKNSKAGILHLLCSLLPRLLRPWFIHTIYVWLIMILVYLNEIHIIHLPPPFTSFPLKRYLFFFISDVRLLMKMTITHPREKYYLIHRMVYSLIMLQNVTYRSMGLCLSVTDGYTTRICLLLL
jgi:hypothetical protein